MNLPTATYRIQFRNGMTLAKAAELVPYLKALGISHLYASPLFAATSGSTHGYDVIDQNAIDPAIGGMEGFERLHTALQEAGLGLILDIVPNHMAASLENKWWRDVIEWGRDSRYAGYFDIDWSEPLTLPVLGKKFADAARDGEIKPDIEDHSLVLRYYEQAFPLCPRSYRELAHWLALPIMSEIADLAENARPGDEAGFREGMRALLDGPEAGSLQEALNELSANVLEKLHAAQPWRLMYWKDARAHLSYRRFFEITGLVGLRVEDPRVFDDAHRLVLELVRSGKVQGLRIDHIDGLADPAAYLNRLRAAVGPDITLHVEKILEDDETLPPDWPIEGTTGYEFISALAGVLTDPSKADLIDRAYAERADGRADLADEERAAKRLIVERNFETELLRLSWLAAEATGEKKSLTKRAVAELLIAFPVYRTYSDASGMSDRDRQIVAQARDVALSARDAPLQPVLERIASLLTSPSAGGDAGAEFRLRFQQLSGPVIAKAIEDTLFYRYNRLIALNEVGGNPSRIGGSVVGFHDRMIERRESQPYGLLATATHDTKRGEDARARLYALSEAPERWIAGIERWCAMNAGLRSTIDGAPAPDAETEWMLYQAFAGVWEEGVENNGKGIAALSERFRTYLEKALREAKLRTDWLDGNEGYEQAIFHYADRLLSAGNNAFLADFADTLAPFARAGRLNSLSQTLLKMTAPGVPDFYQGAEGGDFSLVDPDNRRLPDFRRLASRLEQAEADGPTDFAAAKTILIRRVLETRNAGPDLFTDGTYRPVDVAGERADHVIAFVRSLEDRHALIVTPRLTFDRHETEGWSIKPGWWGDTRVILPRATVNASWRDAVCGKKHGAAPHLVLADVLAEWPVALLIGTQPS